jgi:hypothetical protein
MSVYCGNGVSGHEQARPRKTLIFDDRFHSDGVLGCFLWAVPASECPSARDAFETRYVSFSGAISCTRPTILRRSLAFRSA